MAKTTITVLTCDRCKAETGENVDGSESASFGYDGYAYSLDLCSPHASQFHDTVQNMIGWSSDRTRLTGARRPRRQAADEGAGSPATVAQRKTPGDRDRLRAIREWARKHGHPELGDRGRIPQAIVDSYELAQPKRSP